MRSRALKTLVPATVLAVCVASNSYAQSQNAAQPQATRPLPPGLQKRAEQGKALPPGWEKKLVKGEILDADIYQHGKVVVPLDERGVITIMIEHRLVRLIAASREIVEVLQ